MPYICPHIHGLKRACNIFILTYYVLGTLFLPMGDFSTLKDLPQMYQHCKATEDCDLDVFEFLAEHVSPFGQLIEGVEHETGAEEDGDKPHQPNQSISCGQTAAFVIAPFAFPVNQFRPIEAQKHPVNHDTFVPSDYISKIFRPPIAA